MVSLFTIVYTLFSRLLFIVFLMVIAIPLIICLCLPQRFLVNNKFFSLIAQSFYWFCIKCSFLPITYYGIHNIPQEPCIIAANHQSSFDIPLIGYALQNRIHIWTAWAELAKSLLFRFFLARIAILIDVGSPTRAMRSLVQAISILKEKPWDLIIFPEGQRTTGEKLNPFFGGFALIAQKTGRPVIPIKIVGVHKVYPPFTFWIYYYPITVHIGKPMMISAAETPEAFVERVRNWFIQETKDT